MKEVYLDYSATTYPSKEVIDALVNECKYAANPNSIHKLGLIANSRINNYTSLIANLFKVKKQEIIYTSGASEANNLALKGVCFKEKGHIITTKFEHSSVIATLNYLTNLKIDVDFVECDEFGLVSLNSLKKLIRPDTILISIASINSELGLIEPILEIASFLKKHYPKIIFHVDGTQAVGKLNLDLKNIDLFTMSAHKIFGFKGIGLLIKKENIKLIPLINGGKSTTMFRSGTPQCELIASLSKALEIAFKDITLKNDYVATLKTDLITFLKKFPNVRINSNQYTTPYILNFSVLGTNSNKFQELMSNKGIYLSTKTACSLNDFSETVYNLTNDLERSKSSIRLSLSYLTTKEEINYFKEIFILIYKELYGNNNN